MTEKEQKDIQARLDAGAKKFMEQFMPPPLSDEEHEAAFQKHVQEKYPGIDVTIASEIFKGELEEARTGIPPNASDDKKNLVYPLSCDLNRNIMIVVLDKYIKQIKNGN